MAEFNNQVIQFFEVTQTSEISPTYSCFIPCKEIIQFDFIDSSPSCPRISILTREFQNTTKLSIYELNISKKVFPSKPLCSSTLPFDAYKLQVIGADQLIIFTTSAIYRVSLFKDTTLIQETSTIFSSHPISVMTQISQHQWIATDTGGNLLIINCNISGPITLSRIGSVNSAIKIIPLNSPIVFIASKFGKNFFVNLSNLGIIESTQNSSKVNKIYRVNEDELIGITENSAHTIREALKLKLVASTKIPLLENAYFYDEYILIAHGEQISLIQYTGNGFIEISNEFFIINEPTICFGMPQPSLYIQVTHSSVNNSNEQMLQFENITSASISDEIIGIISSTPNNCKVVILNLNLEIVCEVDLDSFAEAIAVSDQYFAITSWANDSICIYSIETGKIYRKIESKIAVSLMFTDDGLIALESRDRCCVFSLTNESLDKTFYCEGLHNSIIKISNTEFILTGDKPVLLQNMKIKGIEFNGITNGSYIDHKFLLVFNDILYLCEENGFSISIIESKINTNIKCLTQIPETNDFLIVTQNGSDTFISYVEHPLSNQKQIGKLSDVNHIVNILSMKCGTLTIVIIMFHKQVLIYELCEQILHFHNNLTLEKEPFHICTFQNYILIGFIDEIRLYELEIISLSNIELKEISKIYTQGSTSSITVNDTLIIVGDELQSIVIYRYNKNKQKLYEIARNNNDYGIVACKIFGNNIFAVDYIGNVYQMQIGQSKNLESVDINVSATYNFGCPINEISNFANGIVLVTNDCKYFQIVNIKKQNKNFDVLYDEINKRIETLGSFNSIDYRATKVNKFYTNAKTMINLDLLKFFMELTDENKLKICGAVNISIQNANTLIQNVLNIK